MPDSTGKPLTGPCASPDNQPRQRQTDVAVVMCTVDRFDMADRTIASILQQENRLGLRFEMIVVDNSEDALSRDRIAATAARAHVPLRYVHEPRRNISHARNAGIAASDAEFVAFIDDDEIAPADWLDTMVTTARCKAADVVAGPVYPVYEGGTPPVWDPEGQLPVRDRGVPTGTSIPLGATCNILFRAATCFPSAEPFDPSLGRTGGEDTDLTRRLCDQGRQLVWCADSVVTEFQPLSRMTLHYYSKRVFTATKVHARLKLRYSRRKPLVFTYIGLSAIVQVTVLSLPYLISNVWTTPRLVRMRFGFLRGAAKILAPINSDFY